MICREKCDSTMQDRTQGNSSSSANHLGSRLVALLGQVGQHLLVVRGRLLPDANVQAWAFDAFHLFGLKQHVARLAAPLAPASNTMAAAGATLITCLHMQCKTVLHVADMFSLQHGRQALPECCTTGLSRFLLTGCLVLPGRTRCTVFSLGG